jgi:DNA segregation ATPase FtsK/SpoIIIE-like protein
MAKRAKPSTKTKVQRVPPDLKVWIRSLYQRGILGLLLVSLSVVTFLGLIRDTSGIVVDWWRDLLLRTFGWGSYAVVLVGVAIGALLLAGGMPADASSEEVTSAKQNLTVGRIVSRHIRWYTVVGAEIVLLALLGLTHLVLAGDDPWRAAQAGQGGGYVGAVLSGIVSREIGHLATGLILGGVLVWGLVVASGLTVDEWIERIEHGIYHARRWTAAQLTILAARWAIVSQRLMKDKGAVVWGGEPTDPASVQDAATRELDERNARARDAIMPRTSVASGPLAVPEVLDSPDKGALAGDSQPHDAHSADADHFAEDSYPLEPVPMLAQKGKGSRARSIQLPPLELLEEPDEASFDEADLRTKAHVIEDTLEHFGVPAKVVEINWGPRVTQFGVEPGYVIRRGRGGEETERKIRVAKIAALSNDLALALAAAPVRIEAPVPGRSIVGIEVPNSQVSRVSLRRVMESPAFGRRARKRASSSRGASIRLALGEGVAGTPIVADLARMPHLLIAGATGSGKSVCINAIATCLLFQNSPYTLRMVMIDPKRVELFAYNGVPHLYGRVESDVERIVGVLRWLVQVMEERYKRFAALGARHLDDYNRHWRIGSSEYLPRVVVIIDELADMMFFAPQEVEHAIIRLAQMARATGMHLVIATQRPSVDVVTGLIKANFPARIGFAVTSNTDSRVILDSIGAESLLSKGDMLYMAPDAAGLVRLQGCFVVVDEVERTVGYWREWAEDFGWDGYRTSAGHSMADGGCPWDRLLRQQAADEDADALLGQAIDIVRQQGAASASLLQRRMHIGYPRASRLIDEMEERGVIGPAKTGGQQRQVFEKA